MSLSLSVRRFALATLVASAALVAAGPAAAAAPPEVTCAATIAKAMSKCTKKAIGTQAKCVQKTGASCASSDANLSKAAAAVQKSLQQKCNSDAVIAAAGYGPVTAARLGAHFGSQCLLHAQAVADRTFGLDDSRYGSADAAGKKCLLAAAKATGKHMGGSLNAVAKCVATGCTFDFSASATKTTEGIGKKCADFAALVGIPAADYVSDGSSQVLAAVGSPCDPLDTTRCTFPYPSDKFTIPAAGTPSGRRVAIGPVAITTVGSGQPLDASRWSETDGFSVGPMLVFQNTDIDLAETGATPITDLERALDADQPAVLIDAETCGRELMWLERDTRGATIADRVIIGHVGRNLKNSRRYLVALRNMKDDGGNVLPAPASFALYRDNTPSPLLPVEARRAHMEDVFSKLTACGVDRNELYLAWDFTTQSEHSTAGRLLAMRDDAFDILGSDAPSFTVTSTNQFTPMDDPQMFRQVDGTFQVPLYLTENGIAGSSLRVDGNDVPQNQGDYFTAGFRCVIPHSATTGGGAPAVPARPSLYGHGLLGSHNEVTAGNVQDMAVEHNMIFCATTWTGFSSGDQLFVAQVLNDFSRFPRFIDRQHQGMLNQLFLARLLIHPDGFASDAAFQVGGESMIDGSDVFYDGNSQGGILGHVLAAISQDVTRFSLGVPGINYSILLYRSVDFDPYDPIFQGKYPAATDRNFIYALAQSIWDRTDPNGHVGHVTSDTYDDTPAKKLLMQVAFGDHQVAPMTAEIAARTNGAHIHQPTVDPLKVMPEVEPYYDIPGIPAYPYDGSALVIWDSGNPAPPAENQPPANLSPMDPEWADLGACPQAASGGDPHGCPRRSVDARIQKSEFLKTTGAVVDTCSGLACWAN